MSGGVSDGASSGDPSSGDQCVSAEGHQNEMPHLPSFTKTTTKALESQFNALTKKDVSKCRIGGSADKAVLHRYQTILPYDRTLVKLKVEGGPEIDYINANYLRGHSGPRHYIATQGPLDHTVNDFWRMIWQERANRIVMLTRLTDGGQNKCNCYWPRRTESSERYGDILVTTESVQQSPDYNTSILSVQYKDKVRTVHHFQFLTWLDMGLPSNGAHSFLNFWKEVRSYDSIASGPLTTHCSAGVGRSGTFVAFDSLTYHCDVKDINIFQCVQNIRQDRMNMVETKEQYAFLHTLLMEYFKCGPPTS